jgi:hypothetical protein
METVRHVVGGAEAHKACKASWMGRWMPRNGLEQQPKWMEVLLKGGAELMSPFCPAARTLRGRHLKTSEVAHVLLHRLHYALPGWDAAAERRDAQDEFHSAAHARTWAGGDFDADHGLAWARRGGWAARPIRAGRAAPAGWRRRLRARPCFV